MSKNIWVISDTHFSHSNILNFLDSKTGKPVRPEFSDSQEMDETMIQRWNEVVRLSRRANNIKGNATVKELESVLNWMKGETQ